MLRIVFLLVVFLAAVPQVFSQEDYLTKAALPKKYAKIYAEAEALARIQQYKTAVLELDKIITALPNAIDALLFRAALRYDSGAFAEAEQDYEAALQLSAAHYPALQYELARTELQLEKYAEAEAHLLAYKNTLAKEDSRYQKVEKLLADAEVAARLQSHPVPFSPESLGEQINTPGKEYLPSFTADGQWLIYTVNYDGQEDFYFSSLDDNKQWRKGQPLEAINTPLGEGAQNISADGRQLIFTGCARPDGLGSCDLYFATRQQDGWSAPHHPTEPLNTRHWESQPSLSANGQYLYFASDRPGGLGGNDIWVSARQTNGTWGTPANIGPPINTPGNDEAPFLHPDGQTLYFMSDGHPGMGGYDLFVARLENGRFAEPQNLGYPINTSASEGAIVVSLDGSTAYYTTDKNTPPGATRPNFDIYQFELHQAARPQPTTYVKGIVKDASTGKPIAKATIQLEPERENATKTAVQTNEKGEFLLVLPSGFNYQLFVQQEGFLFYSDRFELVNNGQYSFLKPFEILAALLPVASPPAMAAEAAVVLKNVQFETGSAALLPASTTELDRLLALLQQYPAMRIQIQGHTDDVGEEQDNLRLSEARAKSVYDYLLDKGIAAARLTYKGYGEAQPLLPNTSPENRAQNRRTAFSILIP